MTQGNEECVFCDLSGERIIRQTENTLTILSDPYLLEGHLLIIPKKHYEKLSEVPEEVLFELIREASKVGELVLQKLSVEGVDVRQNYRPFIKNSKIKVDHLHFHIIPRTFEDELYKKSMIFEKDVFKDLTDKKKEEMIRKLK